MADDRITIFFEPKGHKELINAMNALARSQKRLTGTTKQNSRSMVRNSRNVKKARKEFNLLGGTLSVVRSKLLVYAFALSLLNRTVGATIRSAMAQEDAEKKLEVQLGYTSESLKKYASDLQKVTRFGDEETLAVMGQISAFTKNEKQIKLLTKATLDLSEGMGIGLNEAGMLVGKTFGSTTNSLSRYGISVSGAVGSQRRLEKLTKSVSDKYGGLSENIDTTSKAVQQMKNALGDASEEIGEAFLPLTRDLSVALTKFTHETFIPFINSVKLVDFKETVKNFNKNGQVIIDFFTRTFAIITKLAKVIGQTVMNAFFEFFITPFITFWHSLDGSLAQLVSDSGLLLGQLLGKNLMKGFNFMLEQFPRFTEFFGIEPFTKEIDEMNKKIAETQKQIANNRTFQIFKDQFNKDIDSFKDVFNQLKIVYDETLGTLVVFTEGGGEGDSGNNKNILKKVFGISDEDIAHMVDMWTQYQQAVMGVANAYEKMTMQNLDNARKEELERANGIRSERRRQKEIDRINKEFDEKTKKRKEDMREIKIAEAISNTALGMTKAFTDPGGIAGWILSGLIAVTGGLQIATIKAQKYAYGGMVGGNRHSQGGTMIEAERGEYVVSRRGVDAIGLQALNRINSGQVGGASVVINNPILSKDVVEDELIPQIKNAIRKGYGF